MRPRGLTSCSTGSLFARSVAAGAAAIALLVVVDSPRGSDTAIATTLFVARTSRTCSDAGPGTVARPFCTVGAAAARAQPGQTVEVGAGAYPESVTIPRSGTPTASIVFTAAPGASVILSGGENGFRIQHQSWVIVKGFTVTNTSGYGIDVQDSSHITLAQNRISNTGGPASGEARSGISLSHVSDSRILANTVERTTSFGINLVDGSARNVVEGNLTVGNASRWQRAASGIRVYQSTGNTISANVAHDNEDSGIELDEAQGNRVRHNVSYDNGDHGIDNIRSPDTRIVENVVYENATAGINVEGNSTHVTIRRNVSVDNAADSPRSVGNIRVESGSTARTAMDYDRVYSRDRDVLLVWDSIAYRTLAGFRKATGLEAHGIEGKPKWVECVLGTTGGSVSERFGVRSRWMCNFLRSVRR